MKQIILAVLVLTVGASASVKSIEEKRKMCEAGDAKSCKVMGDLHRAGLGVERDFDKAHYYYDKSCFDGNKDACKEIEIMKRDNK